MDAPQDLIPIEMLWAEQDKIKKEMSELAAAVQLYKDRYHAAEHRLRQERSKDRDSTSAMDFYARAVTRALEQSDVKGEKAKWHQMVIRAKRARLNGEYPALYEEVMEMKDNILRDHFLVRGAAATDCIWFFPPPRTFEIPRDDGRGVLSTATTEVTYFDEPVKYGETDFKANGRTIFVVDLIERNPTVNLHEIALRTLRSCPRHPNIVDTVTFNPNMIPGPSIDKENGKATLNLWRGIRWTPTNYSTNEGVRSYMETFKTYLMEVLADGDWRILDKILVHACCSTAGTPHRAKYIVLTQGPNRTGKSTYGYILNKVIGPAHSCQVNNINQIVGQFNYHLSLKTFGKEKREK